MSERTITVGMLGCGTVGSAVIRMLHEHADDIALRAGCRVEVTRVAVRDLDRDRDVPVPREAFTTDGVSIVDDPGRRRDLRADRRGRARARSLLLRSFANGKPVVTANKELLANAGQGRVRRRRRRRSRPVVRGLGRRRGPADPAPEGVARRRARHADVRHRERHHELHPHPDVRARVVVRRGARRGADARLRRGRSHRRRRGLRRRRQVRDPRVDRLQLPGRGRRRLPRGHRERHRAGHRRRRRAWATS